MEKEEKVDYQKLIIKFLSEEISDNELVVLKSWIDNDPANRSFFDLENELWRETSLRTKREYFKPDTAWLEISSNLGLGKRNQSSVTVLTKNNFRLLIAAASIACVIALGGIGQYLSLKASIKNVPAPQLTVVATNEGEKSHIFLSDSTKVFLNSGSTLEYDGLYYENTRTVKLTGEAYFEVKTNPDKPFIVKTGKITITATGTKFNVLSYENENRIETSLEKGKISVAVIGAEPIKVVAGQQVVYFKNSDKVIVRPANADTYTAWKENKLKFFDTPFEEAMRGISRRYNVKIDVSNRDLLNNIYTATFIDESIDEVMQYIKAISVIPIKYKIYTQTTINDTIYTKPKIIIGLERHNL